MSIETYSFGDVQSAPGRMVGGIIDSLTSPVFGGADLVTTATANEGPIAGKKFSSAATAQRFPQLPNRSKANSEPLTQQQMVDLLERHAPLPEQVIPVNKRKETYGRLVGGVPLWVVIATIVAVMVLLWSRAGPLTR